MNKSSTLDGAPSTSASVSTTTRPSDSPVFDPAALAAWKAAQTASTWATGLDSIRNLEGTPQALRAKRCWVLWAFMDNGPGQKPGKVPLRIDGTPASSTDPKTWATFDDALAAFKGGVRPAQKATADGRRIIDSMAGIGFVFDGSGVVGVDLDGCRDPQTGAIAPWALDDLRELASWAEVSPTGTGLHVYLLGALDDGRKRSDGQREVYDRGRFFAFTGCHVEGTPSGLRVAGSDVARWQAARFAARSRPSSQTTDAHGYNEKTHTPERLRAWGRVRLAAICDELRKAQDGEKEKKLYQAAMGAARGAPHGYSLDEAEKALWEVVASWGSRVASKKHAKKTIKNGFANGTEGPAYPAERERPAAHERTQARTQPAAEDDSPEDEDVQASEREPPDPTTDSGPKQRTFDGEEEDVADTQDFKTTELGNAERLAARHRGRLRYCEPLDSWFVWDGTRWRQDERGEVVRMAKETVRGIYDEASRCADDNRRVALARHATASEKRSAIYAMIGLAQSEDGIPVMPDELDADPWLLNVENGTIDLRTGELRWHRREDLITHKAPVRFDPHAPAPLWATFLEQVLPDPAVRVFVQRFIGYALTGAIRDHVLPVFWGRGRNGKGTFVEVIQHVMGTGYASSIPSDVLMAKRDDAHPVAQMTLKGRRFCVAQETKEGRSLDEAFVKTATGGDRIVARGMRENYGAGFIPTHKIVLCTNHTPRVNGTDEGIRSRVKLVPWTVTIPPERRDKALAEKLKAEAPGILAWAVRGCLDWQREGLGEPAAVLSATQDYFEAEDVVGAFLDERCLLNTGVREKAASLFHAYEEWAKANGVPAVSQRTFAGRLIERGMETRKVGGARTWFGLRLLNSMETFARKKAGETGESPGPRTKQDQDPVKPHEAFNFSAEPKPGPDGPRSCPDGPADPAGDDLKSSGWERFQ